MSRRRSTPCVYFARADDEGLVKIGYTACLESRLRNLRRRYGSALHVLAQFPGDRSTEHYLHRRFADLRLQSEWFQAAPRLLDYMIECRADGSVVGGPPIADLSWKVLYDFDYRCRLIDHLAAVGANTRELAAWLGVRRTIIDGWRALYGVSPGYVGLVLQFFAERGHRIDARDLYAEVAA